MFLSVCIGVFRQTKCYYAINIGEDVKFKVFCENVLLSQWKLLGQHGKKKNKEDRTPLDSVAWNIIMAFKN